MIKKLLQLSFILLINITFSVELNAQNVGINETGATPNSSAMRDISASTKGLLIPRLSRAQKFLIPTKINFSEMELVKDFFLKMQKIKQ